VRREHWEERKGPLFHFCSVAHVNQSSPFFCRCPDPLCCHRRDETHWSQPSSASSELGVRRGKRRVSERVDGWVVGEEAMSLPPLSGGKLIHPFFKNFQSSKPHTTHPTPTNLPTAAITKSH